MSDIPIPDFDETIIREIIRNAHNLAINYSHEYVTVEHLLVAALENDVILDILKDLEIDVGQIQIDIFDYLRSGAIPTVANKKPQQTIYSLNLLQKMASRVINSGRKSITHADVIVAILESEDETVSKLILERNGLDHLTFKKAITYKNINQKIQNHLSERKLANKEEINDKESKTTKNKKTEIKQAKEILEKFTTNLNELVKEGKITKLIGREDEIFKISKALCRKQKNNVILVGDPGVGKTAIVEGLAYKIVNNETAKALNNSIVYSLDLGALIAGTRFRGDLEERLNDLIKSFITISENEDIKVIFFIDEIHSIIGAGAGSENKSLDISNLLKPALQKGILKAIGATTHSEYRKYIEKDAAFKRRFTKVNVDEPSIEDSILILKGLKEYYENFHEIEYTDEALEEAVKMSFKHIHDNQLPDKAIDIIDNIGAKNKIIPEEKRLSLITKKEVLDETAALANLPVSKLLYDENENIKNLELNLKLTIFGQNEAIETLVSSVLISRAGMRDMNKPEGCYLFNGPTGVGKTELAKMLAKELNMGFVRIDMSEYMEKHAVSRLIGAPPGYVGYEDNGGVLLTALDKNKNSVILFDEIEKAHPDVFNILLQIMDYGKITNSQGKPVYFNSSIIILTGNIGSSKATKLPMGFGNKPNDAQEEEVKKLFAPEFLNRLDGVITFNKLNKEISLLILNKFMNNLNLQLLDKKVKINLSERAIEELLKRGFDELYGARPLSRIIDQHIKKKIAPEILFGDLSKGGEVVIDFEDDFILKIKELMDNENISQTT